MPLYLEDLAQPFEYLDISSLYTRYSQIIDLIIFFLVFLGIAKVTLGRRFEGRGGTAIMVGVSMALTGGFMLMQKTLGFSLHSFGGIGAGMFLFIVGIVLFGMFKAAGLHTGNALCITYAIVYLSMMAVAPSIFDFIAEIAPFINGLLGLLFILSLAKILHSFVMAIRSPSGFSLKMPKKAKEDHFVDDKMEEEKEKDKLIQGPLDRRAKKDLKDAKVIGGDLEKIKDSIGEYGNTEKGRRKIAKELGKLTKSENEYLADLKRLQDILITLEAYDEKELRNLKKRIGTVADKEKPLIEKEILIAEKKIEAEAKLLQFKQEITGLTRQFNQSLGAAINLLRSGNYQQEAVGYIDECMKIEAAIKTLFKDIRILEAELASLVEAEGKTFRKERKKFG